MPTNIKDRYANDEKFREKMKENSRKRYRELKEALEEIKTKRQQPVAPQPSTSANLTNTS